MKIIEQGATINAAEVGDLQKALDMVPQSGGAVYIPAGKYEIDKPVKLSLADQQHLYIYGDGRATVLNYTATDGSHFLELSGVENSWWPDLKITIRDLTVVGNYECGDAFHLLWPNDTMIDSCFFYGFGGCAIVVTPQATNVTIRDCWMRDCKRALHADNLHHLTFHGNQTRSAEGGQRQHEHIYIGRHCREIRIVNNHIAYGHTEGIILDGTAQHVIANNTIEGFVTGIKAIDCRDIIIDSNYLHCPTGVLMEGDNRGITISGNMMTTNYDGAITIRDAYGSGAHVISGNVIRQSVFEDGQKGIDLGDARDCVVTGNLIEDITDGPAIAAGPDLSRHVVANNCVTDSSSHVIASDRPTEPVEISLKSKYYPLYEHLRNLPSQKRRVAMSFGQIERVLGSKLQPAARKSRKWWDNESAPVAAHAQAKAWMAAGWLVTIVKRIEERVVFVRQ